MVLINVTVEKVKQEADGVRSFVLTKNGLFKLPAYSPGAHIDVHCGEGIIRQYSLCGDPADRRRLMIAVRQVEPSWSQVALGILLIAAIAISLNRSKIDVVK